MPLFSCAVIQTNSGNDLACNIRRFRELGAACAGETSARMLVYPENVFFMAENAEDLRAHSPAEEAHPGIDAARETAAELAIYIVIGSVAVDIGCPQGKRANRMIAISPQGEIIARYDKIHMFDVSIEGGESHRESRRFAAGDTPVMFEADGVRFGCTICYDLRFPGLYAAYARAGAHAIFAPSAFTAYTGERHWETLVKARSIETGAYIIAPGQTGAHPGNRRTWGHSMIAEPYGAVPAVVKEGEGYACAQIDTEICARYRAAIPAPQTPAREYRLPF